MIYHYKFEAIFQTILSIKMQLHLEQIYFNHTYSLSDTTCVREDIKNSKNKHLNIRFWFESCVMMRLSRMR